MGIFILTNEFPGGRTGGIGMYIAGLKETLGERLRVEVVSEFPRRITLLKLLASRTRPGDAIWVHHAFPLGIPVLILRIFAGRSYTIFFHGNDFDAAHGHWLRRMLLRFILKGAKHIVVNSSALAIDVERKYGVIPLIIRPWLPGDIQRSIPNIPQGRPTNTVLTVGRFVARKGFDVLLDAASGLPDYSFIFAGPKNAYAESLAARIESESLKNVRLIFDPTREEIIALYGKVGFFAMPTIKTKTDREGFGIVYLEAQYAGLPVIATNYPETREAVAPALHASLLKYPNADSFLEALPHLRAVKPDNLRAFVVSDHTLPARKHLIEQIAE